MSDVEFVTVRHPDVEVPATVARTALPYLAGWTVVDEPQPVAPTPTPTKRTRTRRVTTAPVVLPAPAPVVDVEPTAETADPA